VVKAAMARTYPHIPFERYADDIICHCNSAKGARALWSRIRRLAQRWRASANADVCAIVTGLGRMLTTTAAISSWCAAALSAHNGRWMHFRFPSLANAAGGTSLSAPAI
jgi:hypothetical protein